MGGFTSTELDVVRHATKLFAEHQLHGWSFGWDRAVRRAGQCAHTKRHITLSRYFVEEATWHDIEQVLLHEIAHALVGPGAGHGPRWLSAARAIGYEGGRTLGWQYAQHRARWRGLCPSGHELLRFRRPSQTSSCGACSASFNPAHQIAWHRIEG